MAYSKQTWTNGPAGGTPVSADRLNHVESQYDEVLKQANSSSFREIVASGRGTPLLPYYAGLGGRNLDILFLGDSMVEGHQASAVGKRWMDLVRDDLRARYQPVGVVGGVGYVPAWYASTYTASPTVKWTWTGGTQVQGSGLGKRAQALATGNSGTITFTGTSFKLFLTRHFTSSEAITIAIDGGTATTLTIPGSGSSTDQTAGGYVWTSPALTAGSHTVVVAYSGGAAPTVEGIFIYNGDEASGIRVWDGAHSGYLTTNLAANGSNASYPAWLPSVTAINPALTVIAFGTNEYGTAQRTSTQFASDLVALITEVRTRAARTAFLLLMEPERTPVGIAAGQTESYSAYVQQAYAVAAADSGAFLGGSGVAVIDLTKRIARGDTDPFGTRADAVHFTDKGNRIVADALLGFLTAA